MKAPRINCPGASQSIFSRISTRLSAINIVLFYLQDISTSGSPVQESVSHSISFRDNEKSVSHLSTRKPIFSIADDDSVTDNASDVSMASVAKRKSVPDLEDIKKVCPAECTKVECEAGIKSLRIF